MKTTFKLYVTLVLLTCSFISTGQMQQDKNMGKINLSSFIFKGLGLQYERQISKKSTVAFGISLRPTSSLPFKSDIEDIINNQRVNIDKFELSAIIFTPEFRYYFGSQGAFHGFYLAPYLRFGKYFIEGPVSYHSSTNVDRTAGFEGNIFCYSGGIMAGSNFKLSKNIYLDLWIIGASIGKASGSVNANINLSEEEQKSLKIELDRTDIPLTNIKSEVRSNGATVISTGSVAGLRGLGINIGLRF